MVPFLFATRVITGQAGTLLTWCRVSSMSRLAVISPAHPAFVHTVEFGIYVAPVSRTAGIGSVLYGTLLEELRSEALHVAIAGIALPNEASVALHRKFGFTEVGVFEEYAIKNGAYISSLWMQRRL